MTLFVYLFPAIVLVLAWRILKNPYFGLLVMIAVNPVEALIPLPPGYSAGRVVGVMVAVGWIIHLWRNPEAKSRMVHSKLRRSVWAFPTVCAIGILLGAGGPAAAKGGEAFIKLMLLVTLALMIENMVDTPKQMSRMLQVLVLASLVAVIFPFAYNLGLDLYTPLGISLDAVTRGGRAGNLAGDANTLGVTAVSGLFALMINLNARRKLLSGLLQIGMALVILSGLILSGNRTHFAGFFVFMAVFAGLRLLGPARGMSYSIFVLLALLLTVPWAYHRAPERIQERLIVIGPNVNKYTEGRADLIKEQRGMAFDLLKENPLFGAGLRGFETHFALMAHDSVSGLVGETGMLGLFSIGWLVFSCFAWLIHSSRFFLRSGFLEWYYYAMGFLASVAATLVSGLGGYVFYSSRWFWFALGMSAVIARWHEAGVHRVPANASEPALPRFVSGWGSLQPSGWSTVPRSPFNTPRGGMINVAGSNP